MVFTLLRRELDRYKKRGCYLLLAIPMLYSYFFVLPELFKPFYETILAQNWQKEYLVILSNYFWHIIIFVSANFVYYLLYHFEIPFFESFKSSKYPWPWKEDPTFWSEMVKKAMLTIGFNNLVLTLIVLSMDFVITGQVKVETSIELYPTSWEIIRQMAFFILVEDFLFYWSHSLLHTKWLYGTVHKVHHENRFTFGAASEYAHPIEYLIGNVIPFAMGPKLLGSSVHLVTYWMWMLFRITATIDGHSGYNFPWSPQRIIPFATDGEYHDYHHAENIGNYSSFVQFWDTVLGSNEAFYRSLERKEKVK